MTKSALLSLFFWFAFLHMTANADQTDPRLEGWFAELKNVDAVAGQAIEQQIWSAWYQVPEGASQIEFDAAVQHISLGQFDAALSALETIVDDHDDFAEAHNQMAIVFYILGQDQQSVDAIFRTLALEPRHFGALAGLAQIYLRNDNYLGAIEAADAALAANPHMAAMIQLKAIARGELAGESA